MVGKVVTYVWRHYRKTGEVPLDDPKFVEVTARTRTSFIRPCKVHFLGFWDTVSSLGMYNWNQSFPYTFDNPSVAKDRHTVSLI